MRGMDSLSDSFSVAGDLADISHRIPLTPNPSPALGRGERSSVDCSLSNVSPEAEARGTRITFP